MNLRRLLGQGDAAAVEQTLLVEEMPTGAVPAPQIFSSWIRTVADFDFGTAIQLSNITQAEAGVAQAEQNDVVAAAYAGTTLVFGPDYLIPKPFDPRLMMKIAPAVAKAAADSGVALRPVRDFDAYREKLQSFVYASGTIMKPIFALAKRAAHKRVAYAEGEEERVLRAVQVVVER
jgi:hypothetical protein